MAQKQLPCGNADHNGLDTVGSVLVSWEPVPVAAARRLALADDENRTGKHGKEEKWLDN